MTPTSTGGWLFAIATAIAGCGRERIEPKNRGHVDEPAAAGPPTLSVLVTERTIYLGAIHLPGAPGGTWTHAIARGAATPPAQVWAAFDADLATMKRDYFRDRTDLELAAETVGARRVAYQDLVTAMDHALAAGFTDVGLTDPAALSWRPPAAP